MKSIYFIRHCQTTGQSPDAQLTEEGQKQAESLALFLESFPIDCIVSSPFLRAIHSVEPFAQKKELAIHQDERLSERVLCDEPLTGWMEALKQSFEHFDLRFGQGETSREAQERGVQCIEELLASPFQQIAVVTHGNLMTLLLKHFDQRFDYVAWQQLSNPDVYQLNFTGCSFESMTRLWKD